jgi:chromosome segregation ATPase
MTVKEFTILREKIDTAKTNKARAEGAKAKIEEQVKRDYEINIDEIDDKIKEFKSSLEKCNQKKEKLVTRLETLCDWEEI